MKARKITKIHIHYLKSNIVEKGKFHFVLEESGMLVNTLPIYSNSTVDNDECSLHFACINKKSIPEKIIQLSAILGYLHPEFIEVFEPLENEIELEIEVEKPKKKK